MANLNIGSLARVRTTNHHVIFPHSNNIDFQEEEIIISIIIFPSYGSGFIKHGNHSNYI